MDALKFQEAQRAYETGDYRVAVKGFLAAAGRGALGNGAAYHMAGNALLRLRRHADAISVYQQALRDETYDRIGAVNANIGAARAALGEYGEAVTAYEAALADPGYETPYRAWMGIAAAHKQRNRIEAAAAAYRRAALDEANPSPGRALVNLGVCLMMLGRSADAVEAYKAALGSDAYEGRGKALANLGQAYYAQGLYSDAVRAFEKATGMHGHELSPRALREFEDARARLVPATVPEDATQASAELEAQAATQIDAQSPPALEAEAPQAPQVLLQAEAIESFAEADIVSGQPEQPEHDESRDVESTIAVVEESVEPPKTAEAHADDQPTAEFEVTSPVESSETITDDDAAAAAAALGFGSDADVSDFFSVTEEELIARGRAEKPQVLTQDRVKRLGIAAAVVAAAVLLLVVAGYYLGFGWPTQRMVVGKMLTAYQRGEAVTGEWIAVPDKDVEREMAKIPPIKEYTLGAVDRAREVSTVEVTVVPQTGTRIRYVVTMAREGVTWKVTGVDYKWRSAGD